MVCLETTVTPQSPFSLFLFKCPPSVRQGDTNPAVRHLRGPMCSFYGFFFVVGQWMDVNGLLCFFFSALWVSTGSRVEMQVRSARRPLSTLLIVFLLGNFMFPPLFPAICAKISVAPALVKDQLISIQIHCPEGCSPFLVFASVNFCSRCWRNATADARFPQNRKLLKKNLG